MPRNPNGKKTDGQPAWISRRKLIIGTGAADQLCKEGTRRKEDRHMAENQGPTQEQVEAFTNKLQEFRGTLGEGDQHLLDAMYHAAMGTHEQKDEEVHAYWVARGPRGGVAAGAGWGARPWGVAYNTYYPYYG